MVQKTLKYVYYKLKKNQNWRGKNWNLFQKLCGVHSRNCLGDYGFGVFVYVNTSKICSKKNIKPDKYDPKTNQKKKKIKH